MLQTIHIVGFPEDLKERELNLLFRKTPGFEGAFIKYGGVPPPPVLAASAVAASALDVVQQHWDTV